MGQYSEILNDLRASFNSGKTKSYEWRMSQLAALLKMFQENEDKMADAIYKDLRRPKQEAILFDVLIITSDIVEAMNNLKDWMKPVPAKKSSAYLLDTPFIHNEPFGVTLIVGPWNYPFHNVLLPLVGAIAAGNCAVLKPSEISVHSEQLIKELVPRYMDQDCIQVVTGAVPETTALLEERFDKIFYIGSQMVGRIVSAAAAKHLTPVALELGGKSPVYVDNSADLPTVAKRLVWGKFVNSGQTCIAPDYCLCPSDIQEILIKEMKSVMENFYQDPQKSKDFARIVNTNHFRRVKKLKDGAEIAIGGKDDESDMFIEPTVLRNVNLTDPVMQEEIFGPILPIVPVKNHIDAINVINQRDKPLAMYIFCTDKKVSDAFLRQTSSGALLFNDVLVHGGLSSLPFGGVGGSGYGCYHGKHSFDTFSHKRAVLKRPMGMDTVNAMRYPPYTDKKVSWLRFFLGKKLNGNGPLSVLTWVILGTTLAAIAIYVKKM